jgi:DNA polymerase I-like protein with 3'-5' exonuclease and polymerase domains
VSVGVIKNPQEKELPRLYKGELVDTSKLSQAERRKRGLSTTATIVHVTTNEGLVDVLAYAQEKKRITVDSETDGEGDNALDPLKNTLELIQVGDTERQYIIWPRCITDWSPLITMFADEKICKMGQNLKFDVATWLAKRGLDKRWSNVADAGLIEQILCCGLFSEEDDSVGMTLKLTSMENLAKRWLGLQLDKDEDTRTGWARYNKDTIPIEKLLYAADDVTIPSQIIAKQKPWIIRFGLVETMNLEHAFLPVLADMEVRGIRMDMEAWDKLADKAMEGALEARRKLDEVFDVTITLEIDEEGNVTLSRDKKYTSKDVLKDLIREYMAHHHDVTVIATNKHFKESLIANGFMAERAERLFASSKVPNPKKPGTNKIVGGPNMSDLAEQLWEDYYTYLPKNSLYLPNTESKTLKLFKIINATPKDKLDAELPNKIGLPAVIVDPVLNLRKLDKASGTYGKNWHALVNDYTGRVHFNFVQSRSYNRKNIKYAQCSESSRITSVSSMLRSG